MSNREQEQRKRAYRIWEDEGRPDGAHEEHWRRAGDDQDEVVRANQEMDQELDGGNRAPDKPDEILTQSSPD